jgi:hypothetical protein
MEANGYPQFVLFRAGNVILAPTSATQRVNSACLPDWQSQYKSYIHSNSNKRPPCLKNLLRNSAVSLYFRSLIS